MSRADMRRDTRICSLSGSLSGSLPGSLPGTLLALALVMLPAAGLVPQAARAQDIDPRMRPAEGALARGDFGQAIDILKPLASGGFAPAQLLLAQTLETAPAPHGDPTAAAAWYLRAAQSGVAEAQNNLGAMLYDGRGVQKDLAEAVKWYRAAAERNYPIAQYNLGLLYGKGLGVAADDKQAAHWKQRAAQLSPASPAASSSTPSVTGTKP